MRAHLLLGVLVAAAIGCSGSQDDGGDDAQPTWEPLVTAEWTLGPGQEEPSQLVIRSLEKDFYVTGIRPIDPPGTHHTVLFQDDGTLDGNMIYASGVGTNELLFPEGVAVRFFEGDSIGLQLHIVNASGVQITGLSGIEVLTIPEEDVEQEADMFLPGPGDFALAPMTTTEFTGTCTVTEPQTLFALFPHMHQMGTHLKTVVTAGGVPATVHDAAYDFDQQGVYAIAPMTLASGDQITTTCTWYNPTDTTVYWGESTGEEMCFSIFYRWPVTGGDEFCDD